MHSFLKALVGSEAKPERAIFMNTGVRMTTEGSDLLPEIKDLEKAA
jgi:hypothetical protein